MVMKPGSERTCKLQDWEQTEMAGDSHEGMGECRTPESRHLQRVLMGDKVESPQE